jgi:hypothetical protein
MSAADPRVLGDDCQVTFTRLERLMLLTAIDYYQAHAETARLGDTAEELAALQMAKEIITG